jgi:hypothetical protein
MANFRASIIILCYCAFNALNKNMECACCSTLLHSSGLISE